jgi:ABC-type multidrug transport system fused ATPase/permease subunit
MNLLLNYLKKHKKALGLTLLLAAINQTFSLVDPQVFRLVIDNYVSKIGTISSDDFLRGVGLLLLASITAALISRIAKNFQQYYENVVTQRVGTELYSHSVEHSFSLPYAVFEDQRSGELLQKLQKARLDAQQLILSMVDIVFVAFVGILLVVIYAFFVNWIIGVLYLMVIPIMGTMLFFLGRKIKAIQKNIVIESANLAGSTTETIRNVELVKSLGLEDQETELYAGHDRQRDAFDHSVCDVVVDILGKNDTRRILNTVVLLVLYFFAIGGYRYGCGSISGIERKYGKTSGNIGHTFRGKTGTSDSDRFVEDDRVQGCGFWISARYVAGAVCNEP